MASREEEKRLRREEREKAQREAASSQARATRLRYLIGAVLTIAVVVGVVLLATGGSDDGGSDGNLPAETSGSNAEIPEPAERNLEKAAEAAGCVLQDPPLESSSHVEKPVTYKSNPPTSGNHSATPALDGLYEKGNEPAPENWVHSLEHGRVVLQYAPDTPPELVAQLETLASEPLNGKDAYKVLLVQNTTKMPFDVAASAWGHFIGCKDATASPALFDALRNFRVKWVDKGPEAGIPPTN